MMELVESAELSDAPSSDQPGREIKFDDFDAILNEVRQISPMD
jgi:hypothetical protein